MPRAARTVPWLEVRDGVYYVLWYVPAKPGSEARTKRLSLRTRDADEAQDRYIAFLKQGSDVYRGNDGLTVGQALTDYEREHVNGVTMRNGRAEPRMVAKKRTEACIGHLRRHLGDDQVKSLNIARCEWYLGQRRADPRPVSDSTVRRELSILIAAINHEVKRERVEFNTRRMELPAASHPSERWLTLPELAALRSAGDQHIRDFVDIAYYTASRARAVETMSLFQVKLSECQINLDKPDAVRTKKRRPVVPIDTALRPVVERLYAEAVEQGRSTLLSRTSRVQVAFKRAVVAAGLATTGPMKVTPHTLRHTRATHLLQSGVSVWDVAKLLGDTVGTVEKVYGHHCTNALSSALKKAAE